MNPGPGRTKLENPARRFGTAIPDVAAVVEAVNELAEGKAYSPPGGFAHKYRELVFRLESDIKDF